MPKIKLMKKLLLFLFCIPFLSFTQEVNQTDVDGNKQGVWTKSYKNGKVRYKGQFKNDKPLWFILLLSNIRRVAS